jgi:hypothetical protein
MGYHVPVVAEFFIRMIVAVPVALLWFAMIMLLGRAFGVQLPFRILRQRNAVSRRLTFAQYIWLIGVLGWGCGMWIATTLDDYLDWKYWGGSAHNLSAGNLLIHAVLWPLAGLLFGWMGWNGRTGTASN